MNREKLSSEKQKQYDEIYAEMSREFEELPKPDGKTFNDDINAKRREITTRYLPKLKELFK